jgi:hypothetical protein
VCVCVCVTGQGLSRASAEERARIEKLVDISYVCAKRQLAFTIFPSLVEMEKRHGVVLGDAYANDKSAKEFTLLVGQEMTAALSTELADAQFFTVLVDGSTDVGVQEKELVYVLFINKSGQPVTRLLGLIAVETADALGIVNAIGKAFRHLGISEETYKSKLVGFMSDGASVNFGVRGGVVAKLRESATWLIAIHCLSHRLELALCDSFKGTYFDDVHRTLLKMHALYSRSPKRYSELQRLGDIMNE